MRNFCGWHRIHYVCKQTEHLDLYFQKSLEFQPLKNNQLHMAAMFLPDHNEMIILFRNGEVILEDITNIIHTKSPVI